MDQVSVKLCCQFWKRAVVPEIPAHGAAVHIRDVNDHPSILYSACGLEHTLLPWRNDEMQRRDPRLEQETARDIQGITLQSRHIGGE
jgi:hypothetical protein